MSTFICTKCGAIENTATSNYWVNKCDGRPALCSYCETGKWHGKFKRKHWSKLGLSRVLELQKMDEGHMINAKEHLRNIGVIGSKKSTHKEIDWIDEVPGDIEEDWGG